MNKNGQHVGIIGAMDSEVQYLIDSLMDVHCKRWANMEFYTGTLDGVPATVVKCGVGKTNAALCAQALVLLFGVTCIINTGVAGSLDARINVGDFVVSTDAIEHDFNVTFLGYQRGQIPGMDTSVFVADEHMRAHAVQAVYEVVSDQRAFEGRIASGDLFVGSRSIRENIANMYDALCCEMEGAAIAHACHLMEVPFVVVRAISDKAGETTTVDYSAFETKAAEDCARVVKYMVSHL